MDQKRAFAIFATESEARLHDRREDENADGLVRELSSTSDSIEEIIERGMDAELVVIIRAISFRGFYEASKCVRAKLGHLRHTGAIEEPLRLLKK